MLFSFSLHLINQQCRQNSVSLIIWEIICNCWLVGWFIVHNEFAGFDLWFSFIFCCCCCQMWGSRYNHYHHINFDHSCHHSSWWLEWNRVSETLNEWIFFFRLIFNDNWPPTINLSPCNYPRTRIKKTDWNEPKSIFFSMFQQDWISSMFQWKKRFKISTTTTTEALIFHHH